jgi:ADP-heptose:LPS heptosyltransferase
MENHPDHKKFLLIQTASIGDVILATSVLEKLHTQFPKSSIDLLIKKGCEGLFASHPYIRKLLVWDKSAGKYRSLFRLQQLVRSERYHTIVDLHRFASSGFITAFSKAQVRCGFGKNPFSVFFTIKAKHRIGKKWPVHETVRNQELIDSFAPGAPGPVKLYPRPEDEAWIRSYTDNPFVTISPLSLWFTKQFPAEKWKELLECMDPGLKVFLLGSEKEKERIDTIFPAKETVSNLAGKLSFLQTAALMKQAVMNFTNDSAPLHLASAMNAPVAAVFCSTIPEFGFGPLSDTSYMIQTDDDLRCRPCGLHGLRACPEKNMLCAFSIPVSKLNNTIHYG